MYEIKAKNLDEKNVLIVVENATNCIEAINAAESAGYGEVYASYLSSYREVIRIPADGDIDNLQPIKWYKIVTTIDEPVADGKVKACKYNMLLQATCFEEAQKRAKEQLEQGYSMVVSAILETKVETVL